MFSSENDQKFFKVYSVSYSSGLFGRAALGSTISPAGPIKINRGILEIENSSLNRFVPLCHWVPLKLSSRTIFIQASRSLSIEILRISILWLLRLSFMASKLGISAIQGTHQVAQTSIYTYFPRNAVKS